MNITTHPRKSLRRIAPWFRPLLLAMGLSLCLATLTAAEKLHLEGFLAAQGVSARGQTSWLQGGFGRLTTGGGGEPGTRATAEDALGQFHVTLAWQPTRRWSAFVHGVARAEPSDSEGDAIGVIEAYVQGEWVIAQRDLMRWRLGHFFLPSSRENIEVGWSSPYTLTFSALNSWIGEETRLSGLLGEYDWSWANGDRLVFGVSSFVGNDTNGTLLAWRGWGMADRLSTFGEVLPLPALEIFEPGGGFDVQRDDGTQPFGSDLDDRNGWAGFLRWQRDDRFLAQYTRYDNQGDRYLHDGEYAWDTEMDIFGFEIHRGALSWLGEYLWGTSGMGFPSETHVDIDFEAAYLLASWRPGPFRFSLRFDHFEVVDLDPTPGDDNNEDGHAWTVATFWEPSQQLRIGLEYLQLEAQRPAAASAGFDPTTDGRSIKLELRWYFGL